MSLAFWSGGSCGIVFVGVALKIFPHRPVVELWFACWLLWFGVGLVLLLARYLCEHLRLRWERSLSS